MRDYSDYDVARALMRSLGFTEAEALRTPEAYDSWFIVAEAQGRAIRVEWDGREASLIIQAPSLSGNAGEWGDRWIAGDNYRNKVSDLESGLRSMLDASGGA